MLSRLRPGRRRRSASRSYSTAGNAPRSPDHAALPTRHPLVAQGQAPSRPQASEAIGSLPDRPAEGRASAAMRRLVPRDRTCRRLCRRLACAAMRRTPPSRSHCRSNGDSRRRRDLYRAPVCRLALWRTQSTAPRVHRRDCGLWYELVRGPSFAAPARVSRASHGTRRRPVALPAHCCGTISAWRSAHAVPAAPREECVDPTRRRLRDPAEAGWTPKPPSNLASR